MFFKSYSLKYAAFFWSLSTLSGSLSKMSRALIAAPVLKALRGALKTAPWAWKVKNVLYLSVHTIKPPWDPILLVRDPQMISALYFQSKCSSAPLPVFPIVPIPWASSKIRTPLYLSANYLAAGRFPISPSMEYTLSITIISFPL